MTWNLSYWPLVMMMIEGGVGDGGAPGSGMWAVLAFSVFTLVYF